jgi:hypothetical protein
MVGILGSGAKPLVGDYRPLDSAGKRWSLYPRSLYEFHTSPRKVFMSAKFCYTAWNAVIIRHKTALIELEVMTIIAGVGHMLTTERADYKVGNTPHG